MSLHSDITKQCREIEAQGKKPSSMVMNIDTKAKLIGTLPANRRTWFRPAPYDSDEADRYRGLPIVIDWTMPDDEVKVFP